MKKKEPNVPSVSHDSSFEETSDTPHQLSQAELSNLIRDHDFLKEKTNSLVKITAISSFAT